MAAKIKHIMPLKHAQMRADTSHVPQLRQQGAGNCGNWLVVQIGKAKVKHLRPQGIGIFLLAIFNKLHVPQRVDQTKDRRPAQIHSAGNFAQRHGGLSRTKNFKHAKTTTQPRDEVDIMVGRFSHNFLQPFNSAIFYVLYTKQLAFNKRNGENA